MFVTLMTQRMFNAWIKFAIFSKQTADIPVFNVQSVTSQLHVLLFVLRNCTRYSYLGIAKALFIVLYCKTKKSHLCLEPFTRNQLVLM